MSGATRVSRIATLSIAGVVVLGAGGGSVNAQGNEGSPGPLAATCGAPPASASAAGGGAGRARNSGFRGRAISGPASGCVAPWRAQ